MLIAFGIQYAMRMCRIAICGLLWLSYIFPHYLINGTIFEKKHKMCILIFPTTFV